MTTNYAPIAEVALGAAGIAKLLDMDPLMGAVAGAAIQYLSPSTITGVSASAPMALAGLGAGVFLAPQVGQDQMIMAAVGAGAGYYLAGQSS